MIKRSVVAGAVALALLTAGSGAPVELTSMSTPAPAKGSGDWSHDSCPKNLLYVVCVTFQVLFDHGGSSGSGNGLGGSGSGGG